MSGKNQSADHPINPLDGLENLLAGMTDGYIQGVKNMIAAFHLGLLQTRGQWIARRLNQLHPECAGNLLEMEQKAVDTDDRITSIWLDELNALQAQEQYCKVALMTIDPTDAVYNVEGNENGE